MANLNVKFDLYYTLPNGKYVLHLLKKVKSGNKYQCGKTTEKDSTVGHYQAAP